MLPIFQPYGQVTSDYVWYSVRWLSVFWRNMLHGNDPSLEVEQLCRKSEKSKPERAGGLANQSWAWTRRSRALGGQRETGGSGKVKYRRVLIGTTKGESEGKS
jgi:hypothetical protein